MKSSPAEQRGTTRVTLVILPFFRVDVPPLGAACLAAALRAAGSDLVCLDLRLQHDVVPLTPSLGYRHNYARDIPDLPLIATVLANLAEDRPLLDGMESTLASFVLDRPLDFFRVQRDVAGIHDLIERRMPELLSADILAFTTYVTNFFYTCLAAAMVRQRGGTQPILFGGPQMTQSHHAARLALRSGLADAIVVGEGERALVDIVHAWQQGGPLAVPGTMTYDAHRCAFRHEPGRPLKLGELLAPDFSVLALDQYPERGAVLPLYGSRGCPFRCHFCNEWAMWKPFRQLPPDTIIDWMTRLEQQHGAFCFYFADSLLNAPSRWLETFAARLISRDCDFLWYGYFRADVTPASIEAWQRAGLCRAFVGAEAFTQTALDRMNKRRSVEQNTSAVEAFCEAGIPVEVSHVIGFPGETLGDVHQSWSYYQQLRQRYGNRIMLNLEPFQFCPASQVYEHPEDFGLSVTPWPEEVFRGRSEYRELLAEVPMAVQGEPDVPELMARVVTLRATFAPDPESGREFHSHWIRRFRLRQLRGLKPGYVVELTTPGVKVLPVRREGAGAHLFGKVFALYRDGAVLDVLDERRRCIYEGVLAQRPLADIVWELVALHGGDAGHEMEEMASCLEALLDIGLQFSIRPSCGLGAEGEPLLED